MTCDRRWRMCVFLTECLQGTVGLSFTACTVTGLNCHCMLWWTFVSMVIVFIPCFLQPKSNLEKQISQVRNVPKTLDPKLSGDLCNKVVHELKPNSHRQKKIIFIFNNFYQCVLFYHSWSTIDYWILILLLVASAAWPRWLPQVDHEVTKRDLLLSAKSPRTSVKARR